MTRRERKLSLQVVSHKVHHIGCEPFFNYLLFFFILFFFKPISFLANCLLFNCSYSGGPMLKSIKFNSSKSSLLSREGHFKAYTSSLFICETERNFIMPFHLIRKRDWIKHYMLNDCSTIVNSTAMVVELLLDF